MQIEEVVHYATDVQREEHSQLVHILASLQGRRGRCNHITRTTLVTDSCMVRSSYLRLASKPAAFGMVTCYGRRSVVVRERGDDSWEAAEAEPERSHQCLQATLLGGGNT